MWKDESRHTLCVTIWSATWKLRYGLIWWGSCHTYEYASAHIVYTDDRGVWKWLFSTRMARIWISRVTPMNESCYADEWEVWHIWMSYVTHMNESCHADTWDVWRSVCASLMNYRLFYRALLQKRPIILVSWTCDLICDTYKSCHADTWVMSRRYMRRVTCDTYKWVTSHIWMSHVTQINETCGAYEWVMSLI